MFKKSTTFIVKKVIQNYDKINRDDIRSRYGYLEGWTSIVINFVIFVIKIVFGFLINSISLIADAFHTLSDISTSVIVLFGFRIAQKPSDKEHPFGHGRMEPIATLIIATMLSVTGIEIGKYSIERIIHPHPIEASWIVIGIIAFTVIPKELLAQFSRQLGQMIKSPTLEADFWHHHTDALSSIMVIIALILGRFNFPYLDGYAGVFVAIMIIYMGFKIAQKSADYLLGATPDPALISKLKKLVLSFDEVLDVYDIVVHQYGQSKIASLHIEIPDSFSLKKAHEIVEKIEEEASKKLNISLSIHTDPVNLNDKEIQSIRRFLDRYIRTNEWMNAYNDIWIKNETGSKTLMFDIVVNPNVQPSRIDSSRKKLSKMMREKFSAFSRVIINIDPRYTFR
ncbi:ferrous-iron efflux pump FieF [bacterium BMS3Abin05]|nr:ferrous-iron efflux pump FieF [bacterium BMS3Abin05]GBE27958.1 ferrous-iron efflux pump FieF [bacterium BMS3Bbin03]HDZ12519.1 cation transporter [Bacteroidota bacterium]